MTRADWLRRVVAALLLIFAVDRDAVEPPSGPGPEPGPIPEPEPRNPMNAGEMYQAVQSTKAAASEAAQKVIDTQRQLEIDGANHAHAVRRADIAEAKAVKSFGDTPLYLTDTNTIVYVKDGKLETRTPYLPDTEVPEVDVDIDGDGQPDSAG